MAIVKWLQNQTTIILNGLATSASDKFYRKTKYKHHQRIVQTLTGKSGISTM